MLILATCMPEVELTGIRTFSRMDTIPRHKPEEHNPEDTQFRMNTIPNSHDPEWTRSRMDIIPNGL